MASAEEGSTNPQLRARPAHLQGIDRTSAPRPATDDLRRLDLRRQRESRRNAPLPRHERRAAIAVFFSGLGRRLPQGVCLPRLHSQCVISDSIRGIRGQQMKTTSPFTTDRLACVALVVALLSPGANAQSQNLFETRLAQLSQEEEHWKYPGYVTDARQITLDALYLQNNYSAMKSFKVFRYAARASAQSSGAVQQGSLDCGDEGANCFEVRFSNGPRTTITQYDSQRKPAWESSYKYDDKGRLLESAYQNFVRGYGGRDSLRTMVVAG